MRLHLPAILAALLASPSDGFVLPRSDDVVIGGSDASSGTEETDLIAAYEQVADAIPEAVAAPIGTGSQALPDDLDAISAAASDDATSGGLSRRAATCPANGKPSQFTSGPNVLTLSRQQWEALSYWKDTALHATTPDEYYQIPNWRALKASASASNYKGFTSSMTSYDPNMCADRCNRINGCSSFVIYFERNPTNKVDYDQCQTSNAQTLIKCAFYGIPLQSSQAKNFGQDASPGFYTSIAGSNAYTIVPPNPPDFFPPVNFNAGTINAPPNSNTYMGVQTFPGVGYSPQICAAACEDKSAYNQHQASKTSYPGTYRKCRFFNAFVQYKNDVDPLFSCTYYTASYGAELATNLGHTSPAGDVYTHGSSYGYILREDSEGQVQKKVVAL